MQNIAVYDEAVYLEIEKQVNEDMKKEKKDKEMSDLAIKKGWRPAIFKRRYGKSISP